MLGLTLYNMEQFRNCWPADATESVFGTKIKKKCAWNVVGGLTACVIKRLSAVGDILFHFFIDAIVLIQTYGMLMFSWRRKTQFLPLTRVITIIFVAE